MKIPGPVSTIFLILLEIEYLANNKLNNIIVIFKATFQLNIPNVCARLYNRNVTDLLTPVPIQDENYRYLITNERILLIIYFKFCTFYMVV